MASVACARIHQQIPLHKRSSPYYPGKLARGLTAKLALNGVIPASQAQEAGVTSVDLDNCKAHECVAFCCAQS